MNGEVVALYLGAAPLINDKKILEYVNTLGQHIVSFVPKSEQNRDWRFGVIESSGVNAFAAPGGYILITRGLLNLTETEDQLAFILAHEISHVVKRHHLKVIQKQKQMSRKLFDHMRPTAPFMLCGSDPQVPVVLVLMCFW